MNTAQNEMKKFCIFEDDLPRDGGHWPEYAATMFLCFDRWENDVAFGSLWTFFRAEPVPFQGLDQLLFIMDAVMDAAEQPGPWMSRRHVGEQKEPHPASRESVPPKGPLRPPLSFRPGRLATVAVRVYARQHATMQGTLRAADCKPVCFRSGLELMYLLREIARHPFTLHTSGQEGA